jgi:hypothetical protein
MIHHLIATAGRLFRAQWLALLAIVIVITGSTAAYAATVGKNSVVSLSIKNGQVKAADLNNGAVKGPKLGLDAVAGDKVLDNGLTGADLDESTLGTVPDASSLGGQPASSYLRGSAYVRESALQAGTDKGDGTFVIGHQCDAGDILLSGGPANVNATSDMVESFPSPGIINGWSVRIHKNGAVDTFSVVVLCLDTA